MASDGRIKCNKPRDESSCLVSWCVIGRHVSAEIGHSQLVKLLASSSFPRCIGLWFIYRMERTGVRHSLTLSVFEMFHGVISPFDRWLMREYMAEDSMKEIRNMFSCKIF